jgi:hypothetical protein
MIIIPAFIRNWKVAKKIKPIRAKFASDVADKSIIPKLLIRTLEGLENMKCPAVVCLGEAGDIWQQEAAKLFKKYNVTNFDADGWLICEPKPENEVDAFEVPDDLFGAAGKDYTKPYPDDRAYNLGDFCIEALWGETGHPEFGKNVQWGGKGDFICRNRQDPNDVWIVRKAFFNNTYTIVGEYGGNKL